MFMLVSVVTLFGFQNIGFRWILLKSTISNFKHPIFLNLKDCFLYTLLYKLRSEFELSLFLAYFFFYFDFYLTFTEQNIKGVVFFKLYINKVLLFIIFRYACAQVLLSSIITYEVHIKKYTELLLNS